MGQFNYKGCRIRTMCHQSTDGWVAECVAFADRGNQTYEQQLLDPSREQFPKLEDAEERALQLAMKWVDEHWPWAK